MSIRAPRETVNLAELYEEELMPWSRALQAPGTGSIGPEIPRFLCTVRSMHVRSRLLSLDEQ